MSRKTHVLTVHDDKHREELERLPKVTFEEDKAIVPHRSYIQNFSLIHKAAFKAQQRIGGG